MAKTARVEYSKVTLSNPSNLGGIKNGEDIGEEMVGTDIQETKHPCHSKNTVEGETCFCQQSVIMERLID